MALDATILQDANDLLRVGHVARRFRSLHPTDQAARRFGRRLTDLLAGQQFLEGHLDVAPGGLGLAETDAILIVHAPPIAHDAILVENENLGRADGAKAIGNHIAGVLENREWKVVPLGMRSDLGDRILLIRIDANEGHVFGLPFLGQLRQPWSVEVRQRALNARERHDNELRLRPVFERASPTTKIVQGKVVDFATDARLVGAWCVSGKRQRKHQARQGR